MQDAFCSKWCLKICLPFNRLAGIRVLHTLSGEVLEWWHLLQFSKASRGPFGSKDNSCPRSYRYHRHTTMMAVIIIIRESITHGWLDELSSRHYYEARISRRIDNLVKVRWSQRKLKFLLLLLYEIFSAQSSPSIFTQKYLRKCKDTYFILQNKYLSIYEDSFGAKILRDECALRLIRGTSYVFLCWL